MRIALVLLLLAAPVLADDRVDGFASIRTTDCAIAGSGYTRDEGPYADPGHVRQRFVIYTVGCTLATGSLNEATRVQYTAAGDMSLDTQSMLITLTPTLKSAREDFAWRRRKGPQRPEARRTVMVFVLQNRIEIIVEDSASADAVK